MSESRAVLTRVRRLDAEDRAALLADCLAARGDAVTRTRTTVRVARAGEKRRLSTVDDPTADRTLDAAALCDLLRYGLARGDADRVAERHLGAPLDDLRPPLADRVRRRTAETATPALVALLLLLVGMAVGATGGGAFDRAPADGRGPIGTTETAGAPVATPTARDTVSPPSPSEVAEVPGLGPAGVVDLSALADAHERARSESYVVRVTRERTASDDDVLRENVTLHVEGDRYRAVVTTEGEGRTRQATVYGDESGRWVAAERNGTPTAARLDRNQTGPTTVRPETVGAEGVWDALATPETAVYGPVERDGQAVYRVVGTGVPQTETAAVTSYRVVAHVRPDGFVVGLVVEYTLIGPRQSDRRFAWTFAGYDPTVVPPRADVRADGADRLSRRPRPSRS